MENIHKIIIEITHLNLQYGISLYILMCFITLFTFRNTKEEFR